MVQLPDDLTNGIVADTRTLMKTRPHEEAAGLTLECAGNLLADKGLDPQPVDPDLGPLLRASTGTGGTRILLLGDLRTAPPTRPGAQPRLVGNRLWGRGSLRMLSGAAAAIAVLGELHGHTPCEVSLILTGDAELDRPNAFQRLAQREDSPWDLVVVFAPTNLMLANRAKSEYPIRYVFRSQRSVEPLSDLRANAYAAGIHFQTLQGWGGLAETVEFLSERRDGFAIPTPTLTLTDSVVRAHSEIDGIPTVYESRAVLRAFPGQDPAMLVNGLRRDAKRYGLDAEIQLGKGRPAVETPEEDPGVQALRRLLTFEPEGSPRLVGYDLGHAGAWQEKPSVAFGLRGGYDPSEYVDIDSIPIFTRVLAALPFALNANA